MSENLTPDPESVRLPAEEFTLVRGYDLAGDPGLGQLGSYLPVLAVIAAPFAALGGQGEPVDPLDPVREWHGLLRAVKAACLQQRVDSTPLAIVRLVPPTAARLGAALAQGGADAFRVVHLVCHGERDMLYLEDDDGSEAYVVAEHVVRLLAQSEVRLLVLDGCFSRRLAQMVVEDTPVQAVVGTLRRVPAACATAFHARFYADLSSGAGVREAYRTAIADLKAMPDGHADRYELVIHDDFHEVWLPLPEAVARAPRPLIDAGRPPVVFNVPEVAGFVGRRDLLRRLAADIFEHNRRLLMLAGPEGMGKRTLAAEFAHRYGWRFPDGILWFRCTPMTTVHEIEAALGRLAGHGTSAPAQEVRSALAGRQALIVLERVDRLPEGAPRQEVAVLLAELLGAGEHAALLIARRSDKALLPEGPAYGVRLRDVPPLAPRAARTLAMRQAVATGIEALDVDTIDDFMECTHHVPWLIHKGIDLVRRRGIAAALADLQPLAETPDALKETYVRHRLEWLAIERRDLFKLLIRAQALPAPLDERLALGLTGENAATVIETLVAEDVLLHDGALVAMPDTVREFVRQQFPLDAARQGQVDGVVLQYYARRWPENLADPLADPFRARLDNLRALVMRQTQPEAVVAPVIVARALAEAAEAYAAAGLAEEFITAANLLRERLPEGDDLARLQLATGRLLATLPDRQKEAGWLFQVTLTLEGLGRSALADASLAYGVYLLDNGQPETAVGVLARGFKAVMSKPEGTNLRAAAMLAYEWGRVLVRLGRPADAIKRFEGALAGYARVKQPELAVMTQRDLAETLLATGETERAEDMLRRALATADFVVRRDLSADLRYLLAGIHQGRAEEWQRTGQVDEAASELGEAVRHLRGAVADLLTQSNGLQLARVLHRLAEVQARAGMMAAGAANAARSYALLTRLGQLSELADVAVTLGQLQMAQGNAVAAQATLHDALDLGQTLDRRDVVERAAAVLVRVHQIRARRAVQGDPAFRQDSIAQAEESRRRLSALGLADPAATLGRVIQALSALP